MTLSVGTKKVPGRLEQVGNPNGKESLLRSELLCELGQEKNAGEAVC